MLVNPAKRGAASAREARIDHWATLIHNAATTLLAARKADDDEVPLTSNKEIAGEARRLLKRLSKGKALPLSAISLDLRAAMAYAALGEGVDGFATAEAQRIALAAVAGWWRGFARANGRPRDHDLDALADLLVEAAIDLTGLKRIRPADLRNIAEWIDQTYELSPDGANSLAHHARLTHATGRRNEMLERAAAERA